MHFSATTLALLAAVATQAISDVSQSSSNRTLLEAMSVLQAAVMSTNISPLPRLQHNQYGHDGWIQDKAGTDIWLGNGKSANVAGG